MCEWVSVSPVVSALDTLSSWYLYFFGYCEVKRVSALDTLSSWYLYFFGYCEVKRVSSCLMSSCILFMAFENGYFVIYGNLFTAK